MGRKRHFKGNNRSEDRKRRKAAAESWANTRGDDQRSSNKPYSGTWVLENKRMQAFYRAQGIFRDDDDYESFIHHLRHVHVIQLNHVRFAVAMAALIEIAISRLTVVSSPLLLY